MDILTTNAGKSIRSLLVFIAGICMTFTGCTSLTHECCSDSASVSVEHSNAVKYPCPSRIIEPVQIAYGWPNEIWVYKPKTGADLHPAFGILLLHELNGASPACMNLAAQFANELHCTVYIPVLFGKPGQSDLLTGLGEELFSNDWSGTFLTEHHTPIIVDKLKELKATITMQDGITRWGVVGMCMTGSFPLAFLDNRNVKFVVMAQPATPAIFSATPFWFTPEGHRALGLSASDLDTAKHSHVPVFFFRFRDDHISPSARLCTVRKLVGGRLNATVIGPDGTYVGAFAHNTLTFTRNLKASHNPVNIAVENLIGNLSSLIDNY